MQKILDRLSGARILVVGDIMLDRYWWGAVDRISPEAPVPVVKIERMSLAAGGAANVAVNIAKLGARPTLIGSVGDDAEAEQIRGTLVMAGVSTDNFVVTGSRPTTVKTRLVAHNQQVARIDQENTDPLVGNDEENVLAEIESVIGDVDVIVVSDYAKGLLTDKVTSFAITAARTTGKSILVDPKGKSYSKYAGATLLTPNRREAAEACNLDEHAEGMVAKAGNELMCDLSIDSLLITQGSDGMTLFQGNGETTHLAALARQVFDVTGAGDTVIATLATAVAAGAGLIDAARLANIAAGLVVEQAGTTPITFAELERHANDTP